MVLTKLKEIEFEIIFSHRKMRSKNIAISFHA